MTPALATRADQATHYSAVRARLWPRRRQFILAVKARWVTPTVVELTESDLIAVILRVIARRSHTSSRDVMRVAADAFGVSASDLAGRSHRRQFVAPRQIAMTIAYRGFTGDGPLAAVGRAFGRDPTTVLHAVRKYGEVVEGVAAKMEQV